MVRTEEHKLVHFLGAEYGQLFDLRDDPQEVVNLWGQEGCAAIRHQLLERLLEWHVDSCSHTREWTRPWR